MERQVVRVGLRIALVVVASLCVPGQPRVQGQAPAPDEGRLRSEVATLASPEYAGRRGEGGRKTAAHLVAAFRALNLEPLFDGAYEQPIPGTDPAQVQGRNVGPLKEGPEDIKRFGDER